MHDLRVNNTKLTSRYVIIVNIFEVVCKKKKKMIKEPSFQNLGRVLTFFLTLSLRSMLILVFLDYSDFSPFLGFRLVLESQNNIELRTKICKRKANFLPFECISLLLCSKRVLQNCLPFSKKN